MCQVFSILFHLILANTLKVLLHHHCFTEGGLRRSSNLSKDAECTKAWLGLAGLQSAKAFRFSSVPSRPLSQRADTIFKVDDRYFYGKQYKSGWPEFLVSLTLNSVLGSTQDIGCDNLWTLPSQEILTKSWYSSNSSLRWNSWVVFLFHLCACTPLI